MLRISVPMSPEGWDDERGMFVEPKTQVLQLEHSLVSLSKWESKWHKAFLTKHEKTPEEILDYVKCMTISQNVDPDVYNHLTAANFKEINSYIENPMTATHFSNEKGGGGTKETITSELIYYWLVALQIPFDPVQKWHLNRLLTLIKVCNVKNAPPKKMSKKATASQYAALNAARRKQFNTSG